MALSSENKKFERIPGFDLIKQGLLDISQEKLETIPALLLLSAQTKLASLGIPIVPSPEKSIHRKKFPPHILLYQALGKTELDPYSAYNALRRRLASFCSIAENELKEG
jgi:hypothetical protein